MLYGVPHTSQICNLLPIHYECRTYLHPIGLLAEIKRVYDDRSILYCMILLACLRVKSDISAPGGRSSGPQSPSLDRLRQKLHGDQSGNRDVPSQADVSLTSRVLDLPFAASLAFLVFFILNIQFFPLLSFSLTVSNQSSSPLPRHFRSSNGDQLR